MEEEEEEEEEHSWWEGGFQDRGWPGGFGGSVYTKHSAQHPTKRLQYKRRKFKN